MITVRKMAAVIDGGRERDNDHEGGSEISGGSEMDGGKGGGKGSGSALCAVHSVLMLFYCTADAVLLFDC